MKKDISVILIFLVIVTFIVRVGSFKKEHPLTYDEIVYPTLAAQISENPANYNTIGLYNDALKKGRELLEYFKKPLFKHPPMFSYLIVASYNLFGRTYNSAFLVSLFFGILLIVLAYLLGSLLFDSKAGVYAAFLMSIEPIVWVSSQKIWMETTLAFFSVLSLYLFARAIKKYNPYFMIASGISAGLAVLTKYPGILSLVIIFVYALYSERWLFKKRSFIFSLFIPFIMILPWLYWNYSIYGSGITSSNVEMIEILEKVLFLLQRSWVYLFAFGFVLIFSLLIKNKANIFYSNVLLPKRGVVFGVLISVFACFIFVILRMNIVNTWIFEYVPRAGWKMGMFSKEPWYFYLGRVIELSPFYIFSILGVFLFIFDRQHLKAYSFLFLTSAIILAFYMLWGNYQSRYITATVIPLMVLSARTQLYMLGMVNNIKDDRVKHAAQILFISVLAYAAIKTLLINSVFAMPNNICYF